MEMGWAMSRTQLEICDVEVGMSLEMLLPVRYQYEAQRIGQGTKIEMWRARSRTQLEIYDFELGLSVE